VESNGHIWRQRHLGRKQMWSPRLWPGEASKKKEGSNEEAELAPSRELVRKKTATDFVSGDDSHEFVKSRLMRGDTCRGNGVHP